MISISTVTITNNKGAFHKYKLAKIGIFQIERNKLVSIVFSPH